MQTSIILLALAGWLLQNLNKIVKARGKNGGKFELSRYLSDNIANMLFSLVATAILLLVLPEYTEMTKTLALFTGYFSQAIMRDLLKKDTWKGIFGKLIK